MTIELNEHTFTLLPEKAMYKHDEHLLIIADVHLGKARHFRKEGISIPANAQHEDYKRLKDLLVKAAPKKVYFLGDLFHSTFNNDWHHFCDLVSAFPHISFTLLKGNHDIIDVQKFREICIGVKDIIEDDYFIYSHEPVPDAKPYKVNITGHVHPGILLSGTARQSVKLPCYYVTAKLVIVPAFGVLTGLYMVQPSRKVLIYAVLTDTVQLLNMSQAK